jgi:hypothetical protein
MMSIRSTESGSDNYQNWQQRFSNDNGSTWSEWEPFHTDGANLVQWQPGWIDPDNGRMLQMLMVAGNSWLSDAALRYHVSTDGGHTYLVDAPVAIDVGQKNSLMIAATTCPPIRTQHQQGDRQGKILQPVSITRDGTDFSDAAVLVGTWNQDATISWELSQRALADSSKSAIGFCEPTIAEMGDGRILMVSRGSNGGKADMPGYKWYSISQDGGHNWSAPSPWTYADGSNFYSPSSCSQLIPCSNGSTYWIGNISAINVSGNSPRHPLVIGRIDPQNLMLVKSTVAVIDGLGDGDDPTLQLSNFFAYEDRLSHDIVIDVTRYHNSDSHWIGDSYTYRINVVPEPPSMPLALSALAGGLAYAWRARKPNSMPK